MGCTISLTAEKRAGRKAALLCSLPKINVFHLETWPSRPADPQLVLSTGLETLKIAKEKYSKIFIIQEFFVYMCRYIRNNQKISEKCQKVKKNLIQK